MQHLLQLDSPVPFHCRYRLDEMLTKGRMNMNELYISDVVPWVFPTKSDEVRYDQIPYYMLYTLIYIYISIKMVYNIDPLYRSQM